MLTELSHEGGENRHVGVFEVRSGEFRSTLRIVFSAVTVSSAVSSAGEMESVLLSLGGVLAPIKESSDPAALSGTTNSSEYKL